MPSAPEFLDAEEWKTLEDCVKVLQPSNELTTVLSGEKYPTLSVVIPLLRGFQFTVRNLNTNTDIGQELKVRVLDTVTRRLFSFESNKIVAEACFLDPRFKKYGFGVDENADMAQKLVIEELTQAIMIKERENKEKVQQGNRCNRKNSINTLNSSEQEVSGLILIKKIKYKIFHYAVYNGNTNGKAIFRSVAVRKKQESPRILERK